MIVLNARFEINASNTQQTGIIIPQKIKKSYYNNDDDDDDFSFFFFVTIRLLTSCYILLRHNLVCK